MNIIDLVTFRQRRNWNIFAIILLVRPGLSLNRPRGGSSARCQMQIPRVPTSTRGIATAYKESGQQTKYAYARLISKVEIFGVVTVQ